MEACGREPSAEESASFVTDTFRTTALTTHFVPTRSSPRLKHPMGRCGSFLPVGLLVSMARNGKATTRPVHFLLQAYAAYSKTPDMFFGLEHRAVSHALTRD